MSILEGELAEIIGDAIGGADLFYDAVLSRTTITGGDPYDPGSGVETTETFACQAFEDTYSIFERQNTLIQAGDVKVVVLAITLATTPTTADKITTRGVARSIVSVGRDPAGATWTLQARS